MIHIVTIVVLSLLIVALIFSQLYREGKSSEAFRDSQSYASRLAVINMFDKHLKRNPTPKEITSYSQYIDEKKILDAIVKDFPNEIVSHKKKKAKTSLVNRFKNKVAQKRNREKEGYIDEETRNVTSKPDLSKVQRVLKTDEAKNNNINSFDKDVKEMRKTSIVQEVKAEDENLDNDEDEIIEYEDTIDDEEYEDDDDDEDEYADEDEDEDGDNFVVGEEMMQMSKGNSKPMNNLQNQISLNKIIELETHLTKAMSLVKDIINQNKK